MSLVKPVAACLAPSKGVVKQTRFNAIHNRKEAPHPVHTKAGVSPIQSDFE